MKDFKYYIEKLYEENVHRYGLEGSEDEEENEREHIRKYGKPNEDIKFPDDVFDHPTFKEDPRKSYYKPKGEYNSFDFENQKPQSFFLAYLVDHGFPDNENLVEHFLSLYDTTGKIDRCLKWMKTQHIRFTGNIIKLEKMAKEYLID